MVLTMTGEIRPNGPGHDLYLVEQFAQDSLYPFEDYDQYRAVAVPETAVVLLPERFVEDLPVTLTISQEDING